MKRYFYKEKDYYYFGFDYDQSLVGTIKNKFKGKWNPANFEWYVRVELWNVGVLNKFIEENGFVEEYPRRKRDIKLSPIREKLSLQDVKLLISELNFKRTLRDYQIEGIHYMINHGNCVNGCSCGLGKTSQAIVYLELLDLFPCIIICPSSVKEGWKKEWAYWNPDRSISIISSGKKQNWEADVIVINYDLLGKSKEKKILNKIKKQVTVKFPELIERKYYAIVGDEIHFLKNRQSMRSQAFIQIASKISTRLGLSGTLIMNRPSELKNILRFLGRFKDVCPDSAYFDFRYCNAKITDFGRDVSCGSNIGELHQVLKHYCYFRKEKREVLTELPPITEQLVETKLSNKKVYQQAEEDLLDYLKKVNPSQIEKALRADQLVKLNILFQLSIEGKQRQILLYIKEWLEANEEEKLIVFGLHKKPLTELSQQFENSCLITGDLSLDRKMQVKGDFITKQSKRVLFANIQCIGTGVDGLQEVCSNVLVIELPMKPSDLEQAIGRVERMGQKSNINIYYLLSSDTIDMKIWKLLKEKKQVADIVNKGYVDDISLELINSYRDPQ